MPTYEARRALYRRLWDTLTTRESHAAPAFVVARGILAAKSRYREVEEETGVPWFLVGMLHDRESGRDFATALHNGERIIGTGRRTRLVPAGRGPFQTWQEAAVDALELHDLHEVPEWPLERIAYEAERFNGWGYIPRNINSPYLWSGSNHYRQGKYVADGQFSASKVDMQLGVMVVLKHLMALDSSVSAFVNRTQGATVTTNPPVAPVGEPNASPPYAPSRALPGLLWKLLKAIAGLWAKRRG
jgi:lysozyme family protein